MEFCDALLITRFKNIDEADGHDQGYFSNSEWVRLSAMKINLHAESCTMLPSDRYILQWLKTVIQN